MRKLLLLLSIFIVSGASAQTDANLLKHTKKGKLLKFKANPSAGFNYDYLLFIPGQLPPGDEKFLMVETNNTGVVNDSIEVHEKAAISSANHSGVAHYTAFKLALPLLIPIFPRPESRWQLYTHALDKDTFLEKGDLERLDLQLLAMIEDARKQLASRNHPLKEKFFISGFSASGTFANRFSLLHPEKIQAMAAGGINAIAILPLEKLKGEVLNYPLGIADVKKVTGSKINHKAFKSMPKMLYMGSLDDNDAAAFDDAYNEEERQLIYNLMGKPLNERWKFMEQAYKDNGVAAEFITYFHFGHGTDLKILDEIVEFFRKHAQ